MKTDRETQRHLVAIIKRLDEALALLDRIDRGDGDSAAFIQRAVDRAKRELRSKFGLKASPLPTYRTRTRPFRRGYAQAPGSRRGSMNYGDRA
jgi:hypothetical protein